MKINEIEVGYIYSDNKEGLRKARAASAETKISALMSKISTLVDKRLSCEPCAEAEEDLLQFLRTRYAAPAHPAEGVPSQTVPVGYVALAALTSRTHADDYAKCFATETALLENYPAAKVIAVFDHAATQPAAQGMEQAIEWPKARDVGRFGDMSPDAFIRVGLDADNDVYVSICDGNSVSDIEFCTPGGGGGRSSRTRMALIALMCAIEADNASHPAFDFWQRNLAAQAKQGGHP